MAFISGIPTGTYMVHPKQMNVDLPANTDDIEIEENEKYGKPLEVFTNSTSLLFQIEISIVYREIVDSTWESGCDIDELPYELVLQFDKKLNNSIYELGRKIDAMRRKAQEDNVSDMLEKTRILELLARQRSANNFSIHTRIARLHRPFLIRGAQDPQFAYSRMVCLRSARGVIELTRKLMASGNSLDSNKIVAFNHLIFVSTMILVMDYCFNRAEPGEIERKAEILDCFALLDNRRSDNRVASRGLHTLKELVRRRPKNWDGAKRGATEPVVADVDMALFVPQNYLEDTSSRGHTSSFPFRAGQTPNFGSQEEQRDLALFEDLDWDAEFDHGQFDALFEKIEGQA